MAHNVSSILRNIPGMYHLGFCTGPLANFPLLSQLTQNVGLSTTFLIWGIKKNPLVLDQLSKEVEERLLSLVSPKTDNLIAMCARAHRQHGASISLTSKHRACLS
jgi:hypothetical protein